jgi:putative ABC transport system permease protein
MTGILQDLRYAVRQLARAPGFTSVVVLTLALVIGATAAVFSVVDGVLLKPLPYPNADRLAIMNEQTQTGSQMSVSWPNFKDWRDQNQVFEHFGIYRNTVLNLTGGDRPERVSGAMMSSAMFPALGMSPLRGRTFTPREDESGTSPVVIISHRLWQGRFATNPSILGQSILLNGIRHEVVGVMSPAMRFPSRLTDAWVPLGLYVDQLPAARGNHPGLTAAGALKSGLTIERARSEMDTIARRLAAAYPETNKNNSIVVTPYYELVVRSIRPALTVLVGAVVFVLLIACANLANVMLARADRRRGELSVRAALGAGRWRLIRQMLAESVMLSLAGGALGVVIAFWSIDALKAAEPASIPRFDLLTIDLRVFALVAFVSVATGVIFGVLPAIWTSSTNLQTALKDASRGAVGNRVRWLRSSLVVAEVACALVLLVGAGLMLKSFSRMLVIETGFNPERVLTMRLTLPASKYNTLEKWQVFHAQLIDRVSELPGIEAAGLNSGVPLEGGGNEASVIAEGQPLPGPDRPGQPSLFQVTGGEYFRAMGIEVIKGRTFTRQDTAESVPVAVVDDMLAAKLFPAADPIGKRIAFEFEGSGPADAKAIWREVVGVVRHVRHYGLTQEPPFVQIYTPLAQTPFWFRERQPSLALFASTALESEALVASIRRELTAIDSDIPIYGIQPMREYVSQRLEQSTLSATLLGVFASLALILAIIGIYGVLSFTVSQRTQEIGLRMALGATRESVLRLVVGEGAILAAIGIALGLGGALVATRALQTQLYEVSPTDPATFAAIVFALTAVALAASYLPARRAARVDPLVALRYE